jgi:hypothetical protein
MRGNLTRIDELMPAFCWRAWLHQPFTLSRILMHSRQPKESSIYGVSPAGELILLKFSSFAKQLN